MTLYVPTLNPARSRTNDIISLAVDTGINGQQSATFEASGAIGDNQDLRQPLKTRICSVFSSGLAMKLEF